MDTVGKVNKVNNDKGFALVYLALLIVVLVAIVGLAVDVGYMYVTKGQLQNAADSAALAGAAHLKTVTTNITAMGNHSSARRQAWRFACKNSAATKNVFLVSSADTCDSPPANLNDSNDPNGDIVLGHWNRADSPPFTPADGVKTINAVKVLARRTTDSPGGQVDTFFARILNVLGYDWSKMSAASDAIAAKQARATTFLAVCTQACPPNNPPTGEIVIDTGPPSTTPPNKAFAWSSIFSVPTGPGYSINDIVCSDSPNAEVCGNQIYTTMGTATVSLRNIESVMYDPSFDTTHKDIDPATGRVTGWTVTVPVTADCPPGSQGSWDPHNVWGYATLHIKAICAQGMGSPCRPYSARPSDCNAYPNGVIVIDQITCVDCANSDFAGGLKPALVQ